MDYNGINWEAIVRFLNGESTPEETSDIKKWMNESAGNEAFIIFLMKIWHLEPRKKVDVESAWDRFNKRYEFDKGGEQGQILQPFIRTETSASPDRLTAGYWNRRAMNWNKVIGAVAGILLTVTLFIHLSESRIDDVGTVADSNVTYREFQTDKGQRTRITLTDGSVIYLNSESYLKMPEEFREDTPRRIYLIGEAFFEIPPGRNETFRIIAGETVTTVLGTRFNVRFYCDEPEVTVVVAEGRVLLGYLNDAYSEQTVLTRAQKGVIGNGAPARVSMVPDLSVYSGWIEGKLVFDHLPVPEMITRIERWYGVDIKLIDENGDLADKRLTATFTPRQPVDDVLQSIAHVLDLSLQKKDTPENGYKLVNEE